MASKYSCDCGIIHAEAVEEVSGKMLDGTQFTELEKLFKMFADKTRLRILWALSKHDMCVCDLAALLDMTKSAVSHQLKFLRFSNLIKNRKEGKIVYYSLADDHSRDIVLMGYEHICE